MIFLLVTLLTSTEGVNEPCGTYDYLSKAGTIFQRLTVLKIFLLCVHDVMRTLHTQKILHTFVIAG